MTVSSKLSDNFSNIICEKRSDCHILCVKLFRSLVKILCFRQLQILKLRKSINKTFLNFDWLFVVNSWHFFFHFYTFLPWLLWPFFMAVLFLQLFYKGHLFFETLFKVIIEPFYLSQNVVIPSDTIIFILALQHLKHHIEACLMIGFDHTEKVTTCFFQNSIDSERFLFQEEWPKLDQHPLQFFDNLENFPSIVSFVENEEKVR